MSFRGARMRAGKKVADVVEQLHVTDGAVYMWETGMTYPTVEKLKKLAAFYDCTVDDLLKEDST